ncbi:MAG: tetratricopeptide repeat protein [Cyanobacteria bacterium J06600_6]
MNDKPVVGKRYQLIKELGKNELNKSYLANDTTMPGSFRCVVKQFPLAANQNVSSQKLKDRYENETYLWQQLADRDRVPPILACFEEDESLYLVRELIAGRNLAEQLEQHGKLNQEELFRLLKDVLSSLDSIHQLNFVHQNLRPSNIIRCDRQGKYLLVDFTLAEAITDQSPTEDRETTVFYGSNEYYPDQQLMKSVNPRQDIYALGAIAIEAITGKKPEEIPSNSSFKTLLAQQGSQFDSQLLQVIERMMNFDSVDNYSSAEEVIKELESLQLEPKIASDDSPAASEKNGHKPQPRPSTLNVLKKVTDVHPQRPRFKPKYLLTGLVSLLILGGIGELLFPVLRPQYYCNRGKEILYDDLKAALKSYQQAINLNSKSVCGWLGKAQTYYELERYPAAIAAYDRVDRLKPDLVETWQGRGEVLYRLERFEAATTAYNKTLRMQPDNSAVWNRKGKALYKLELFPEALAAQDKAISLDPDNIQALTDRGIALIGLGQFQQALAAFNQAQEIDPLDPKLWQNKALVLQYLNRPQESTRLYQEALEAYDSVIIQNPQNITALLDKANVLSKLQRHEQALNTYEQAVFINENSHLTWLGKGNALFALQRYDEALAAFDRAVKVQPKSYISWHNRGSLLRDGIRDLPEAIASYDRSLKINPNFYHGWRDRGIALSQSQQHQAAIASFKKALKIKPNDHQSWVGRGIALSSLGKTEEAISVLDRAVEIQPQDPFIWMNRGAILEMSGNNSEACNSYSQVKKIRPGFSPAIQKLKQLGCM